MVAQLRTIKKLALARLLLVFYAGVFILAFFAPDSFIPVSFDSGGVTTGPITVPFIMALGIGMASVRSDKHAADDSFGLVALCSIGPILSVLLLGIFYQPSSASYTPVAPVEVATTRQAGLYFAHAFPDYFGEVALALAPIALLFLGFQLATRRFKRHQLLRICVGLVYAYLGLVLFLTGVNVGFMPAGQYIGGAIGGSSYAWVLVPAGMLIGYYIVKAEPAVQVLNKQVENVTGGAISQRAMMASLSIGMAVDANVIIFARVREEMSKGKSVRNSLKTGFQKAMSAIVDGNVTTLIAAAVLWFKGSGSVKGFAQTLAIGIIVSMFTALVITRMIVYAFYAVGLRKEKLYYRPRKERKSIDFLSRKKWFFALSLAVVILGFVFMGINGSKGKGAFAYSLEFEGGTSTNVTFNKDYTIEEIDKEIVPVVEEVTGDANVQTQKVADTNQVIIKTKTLSLDAREALNKALADSFKVDESLITAENISSTVSKEMRQDAIMAVIIATIFMLIYIWFRFKDIRFAASAVTALLHDVLVVLAFYAVARISVGNTFIACMLTIVGYSINATIVIFDRIREELRLKTKAAALAEVVNKSITQTLTRSIYTSLTTFVMVAVLFVMGVSSIREFALPLMVGIICGAYSSVCITGALWYVMRTKLGKKTTDTKKK